MEGQYLGYIISLFVLSSMLNGIVICFLYIMLLMKLFNILSYIYNSID